MSTQPAGKEQTAERVIRIVNHVLKKPVAEIRLEDHFSEDLGADSLDMVQLLMDLEEEFGDNIPEKDAAQLKTVGAAVDYIESRRGKPDSAAK